MGIRVQPHVGAVGAQKRQRFPLGLVLLLAGIVAAIGLVSYVSSGRNFSEFFSGGFIALADTETPTPTATALPTVTPTPEPTATEVVVETSTGNLEWLKEEIFPLVQRGGCVPQMEITYYPEVVSIPITTDQNGNMVQGVTYLDFCGDGTNPPYVFFVEWRDLNFEFAWPENPLIGPTYVPIVSDASAFPSELVGFVSPENAAVLRETYISRWPSGVKVFPQFIAIPMSTSVDRVLRGNYAPTTG